MYNIRIVAGQILHNPNGRKKGESGSLLALSQSIENHGKSMKIISNQNLLQSIKQAGVQNSPKWDLGDLRSLDTWNLQELIIDLRSIKLCMWLMITVLVSFPIPSKYHPKYKGLKLLKPQIFGFFQGFSICFLNPTIPPHPNPPRNPQGPRSWLRSRA